MLEIRLVGGLELRADGAELALPASKRARAVLAYLALNPGPQPRSRLAARFWPDVLDESARASLRVALTELRQALGPAARHLIATRDAMALDGPDLTVDAREFERALDQGDPARALAACGAPILDGFDEEWAIEARDEHVHRLAGAFESVAAAADDPAEAVRLTRAEVALDALAEAPNRRLIERLAANGDRAAALSAARQFAERGVHCQDIRATHDEFSARRQRGGRAYLRAGSMRQQASRSQGRGGCENTPAINGHRKPPQVTNRITIERNYRPGTDRQALDLTVMGGARSSG